MASFLQPEQQQTTLGKISEGLGGIGAGLSGRGIAYRELQNQERKELSQERMLAAAKDVVGVNTMLRSGDLRGAHGLIEDRLRNIQRLNGGDMTDAQETMNYYNLSGAALGGDENALQQLMSASDADAATVYSSGLMQAPVATKGPSAVQEKINLLVAQGVPIELASRRGLCQKW